MISLSKDSWYRTVGWLSPILFLLTVTITPPLSAVDSPVTKDNVAEKLTQASTEERVPAAEAARAVALSSHRFQHLFRDSTGIPFRRYQLWLRLLAAVDALAGGASLTDSAHAAGFSDSAHLSRTFRRTFGISPSTLVKNSEFVQGDRTRAP